MSQNKNETTIRKIGVAIQRSRQGKYFSLIDSCGGSSVRSNLFDTYRTSSHLMYRKFYTDYPLVRVMMATVFLTFIPTYFLLSIWYYLPVAAVACLIHLTSRRELYLRSVLKRYQKHALAQHLHDERNTEDLESMLDTILKNKDRLRIA